MRTVLSIVAGIICAMIMLIAVELFSAIVHPVPEGFGYTKPEMCLHVANYPPWVLAAVIPMWGGIAFSSAWVAGKLGNRISAASIGTLILAAFTWNCAMLPYPTWFKIIMPVVALFAVVAAARPTFRHQLANNVGSESKGQG